MMTVDKRKRVDVRKEKKTVDKRKRVDEDG